MSKGSEKTFSLDNPTFFTDDEVAAAIKTTKSSKAFGPDGLAPIVLKHLGQKTIQYLTATINLSLVDCAIPSYWKCVHIIPIPKSGKPVDMAGSYRPIALLSPVAKLIEKLLLPSLKESLPVVNHQHGFRFGRSTTTCLDSIYHMIATGLNQPKPAHRMVLVALDLSKPFGTVLT